MRQSSAKTGPYGREALRVYPSGGGQITSTGPPHCAVDPSKNLERARYAAGAIMGRTQRSGTIKEGEFGRRGNKKKKHY